MPSKHGQLPDDLHESISRQAGAFISRQRTDAQVEGGFVSVISLPQHQTHHLHLGANVC